MQAMQVNDNVPMLVPPRRQVDIHGVAGDGMGSPRHESKYRRYLVERAFQTFGGDIGKSVSRRPVAA